MMAKVVRSSGFCRVRLIKCTCVFTHAFYKIILSIHIWKGMVQNKEYYFRAFMSSVQSFSWVQLFATPWTATRQATLSITNSQSLLKLMSIALVIPSSHLILCCPLFLLPRIPPSIRVFSNESTLRMRWPKYWSFIFSISPSSEHPGLISFRTDWLDLLAVQGTLQSLLQYHSLKALILRRSALEYITCLQKFRQ